MRGCGTYKVRSLDETEEESNSHKTSIVLSSCGNGRDQTPEHYSYGQVDGRLAEFVEK